MEEVAKCSSCGGQEFVIGWCKLTCAKCKREYLLPDTTMASDLVDMVNAVEKPGIEMVAEEVPE